MSSTQQTGTTPSRTRARLAALVATAGLVLAGAPALSAPAQAASHGHHRHHGHHHAHHHRHHVSGAKVMRIANKKKGAPYRYGAEGPRAFDCSGFTRYVYKKAGKRLPRTSSAQYGAVRHVSRRKAHRGDLVFFRHGGHVYHVGILARKGKVLHAPRSGERVHVERIWTKNVRYGRA